MSLELQLEISVWVLLAAALSALIGFNREKRNRPAGLRTHMLVGIGSCLFTLLSIHAFPGGDPARVAAQIVSGLGFLGAGAILKERGNIEGLTTAASMWATAAIGMAVGLGGWLVGMLVTLIVWFVLAVLAKAEPNDLK
jgi:putative Mg2+ transporter-C (MgtC) family protein